jgi:hypothetical protein
MIREMAEEESQGTPTNSDQLETATAAATAAAAADASAQEAEAEAATVAEAEAEVAMTVQEAKADNAKRPKEEPEHGLPLQSNVVVQHTHAITDGIASRLCRARLQLQAWPYPLINVHRAQRRFKWRGLVNAHHVKRLGTR